MLVVLFVLFTFVVIVAAILTRFMPVEVQERLYNWLMVPALIVAAIAAVIGLLGWIEQRLVVAWFTEWGQNYHEYWISHDWTWGVMLREAPVGALILALAFFVFVGWILVIIWSCKAYGYVYLDEKDKAKGKTVSERDRTKATVYAVLTLAGAAVWGFLAVPNIVDWISQIEF